jgi:hypothetical protein
MAVRLFYSLIGYPLAPEQNSSNYSLLSGGGKGQSIKNGHTGSVTVLIVAFFTTLIFMILS